MMEFYDKRCLPIFPMSNYFTCAFISLGDKAYFLTYADRPEKMPPCCRFSGKTIRPGAILSSTCPTARKTALGSATGCRAIRLMSGRTMSYYLVLRSTANTHPTGTTNPCRPTGIRIHSIFQDIRHHRLMPPLSAKTIPTSAPCRPIPAKHGTGSVPNVEAISHGAACLKMTVQRSAQLTINRREQRRHGPPGLKSGISKLERHDLGRRQLQRSTPSAAPAATSRPSSRGAAHGSEPRASRSPASIRTPARAAASSIGWWSTFRPM